MGIWVRVISHSVSDGLETLDICIWWWDGRACKVSWPSNAEREITCAQIANFYVGNLHFCIGKSGGFGRTRSHIQCQDGNQTLQSIRWHTCIWWWNGPACKVSWPSDVEREIACVQIANFYVGNLHFCIVKNGYLGACNLTFGVGWPWNFARMYMVMGWTRVQSFMAIRCRTWDRVRPNHKFLCRKPTFSYNKKRGIWVGAILRSTLDGHETLHICIWWWDRPTYKFSRPSDVEREIACAQIANCYVGNLHFRIVKNRDLVACAISHLALDGHEALYVCIWWWHGSACKVSWPSDSRTWDPVRPNRQFLCREPSFLYSKKRGIWVHAILTFDVGWPWNFAHMYMVMGWSCVQSLMAIRWPYVRSWCAQIANFYVGNLYFRKVKSRGFGCAWSHIQCRMAL